MPEESEELSNNSELNNTVESNLTARAGGFTTGLIRFATPTSNNSKKCPICGKDVGGEQPHIYLEHNDGKTRYKMYSCRIHSGKCYKIHLLTEQALIVIRKHLWDKHEIVGNEDQIHSIIHKIELAKHIKEGKTIEWRWEIQYIAHIYGTNPEGVKSFVENDLSNQVNYIDMTWTPLWQLVE